MFERLCLPQCRLFTFVCHYASREVSCRMLTHVSSHIFIGCRHPMNATFGNTLLCTFKSHNVMYSTCNRQNIHRFSQVSKTSDEHLTIMLCDSVSHDTFLKKIQKLFQKKIYKVQNLGFVDITFLDIFLHNFSTTSGF